MNRVRPLFNGESADCGAACLTIVARAFGHDVDLAYVRQLTKTSGRGVTLAHICEGAQKLSLAVRAIQVMPEELRKLAIPAILHWEMDHFVVLDRVRGSKFWIIDPRYGRRAVREEEIRKRFTGVAVEFERASSFVAEKQTRKVALSSIISIDSAFKTAISWIVALSFVGQVISISLPLLVQIALDDAGPAGTWQSLSVAVLGFGCMVLSQAFIFHVRNILSIGLVSRISNQMTAGLFLKTLCQALDFFERRNVGDIVSRFSSLQSLQRTLGVTAVTSLVDGVFVVLLAAVMWSSSFVLFAITFLGTVISIGIKLASLPLIREALNRELVFLGREQAKFIESLRGIVTVKALGIESERFASWNVSLVSTLAAAAKGRGLESVASASALAVTGMETILVIVFGVLSLGEDFTIGMLVAFIFFKSLFLSQMSSLVNGLSELWLARTHLHRVSEIIDGSEECGYSIDNGGAVDDLHNSVSEEDRSPSLRAKDLSFGFEPGRDLFRNISFETVPGMTIAIKGRSGRGKSTLIKVLLGLYKPGSGTVTLNGIPVDRLDSGVRRSSFSAVMQDEVLFTGSISENIAAFSSDVDYDRVAECAKHADIHADIVALPMGYHTLVGNMGASLSGGQRQRIAIARALYTGARIIFFDEATSHLDIETEKNVHAALNAASITRVVASHRPWIIEQADLVLDLDNL